MSALDPQIARELAREQILNHARNLAQDDVTVFESVVEKDACIPLSISEREALSDAVLAEIGRAQIAVTWPDERPATEQGATDPDRDAVYEYAVRTLRELATSWLAWYEGDRVDPEPGFPESRMGILAHLRQVVVILDRNTQLEQERDTACQQLAGAQARLDYLEGRSGRE